MRNYFTFDKFDSRDFGVYISGTGTFASPTREYDNIVVPGRNGDLLGLEHRLENVKLTYPAFMYTDFRKGMTELRSALLSVIGYARLYDTYHPDEYRLAVYKGGLEPDVVGGNYAGQFDITFECLPQRFLIEGEKQLTYPPGIEDSKNLLPYPYSNTTKTENGITWTDNGDGTITVNGTSTAQTSFYLTPALAHSTFRTYGEVYRISLGVEGCSTNTYFITGTFGDENRENAKYIHNLVDIFQSEYEVDTMYEGGYFGQFYIRIRSGVTVDNLTFKPMIRLASETDPSWVPYYDGATSAYNPTLFDALPLIRVYGYGVFGFGDYTITIASHNYPYIDIDCDLMECYYGTTNCNSLVSFNSVDFPMFAAGVSGITYPNTITKVEITPKTWRP